MSNISPSKGNQAMKFGQLIEYNKRNIFSSKIMRENEGGRLVPDLVKASGLQFGFNIFR